MESKQQSVFRREFHVVPLACAFARIMRTPLRVLAIPTVILGAIVTSITLLYALSLPGPSGVVVPMRYTEGFRWGDGPMDYSPSIPNPGMTEVFQQAHDRWDRERMVARHAAFVRTSKWAAVTVSALGVWLVTRRRSPSNTAPGSTALADVASHQHLAEAEVAGHLKQPT